MVTLIYNVSRPEHGGVGRYSYEVVKRASKSNDVSLMDSSSLCGTTVPQKLYFTLAERKKFLRKHLDLLNGINHYLQVEMFYRVGKGRNIVTFHNPPPFTIHNHLAQIKNDIMSLSTSLLFFRRYSDAMKYSDVIVANSEFTKEGILETGLSRGPVVVSFGGVDDSFRIERDFERREDIIGYIGSYAFHKRIGRLLKENEEAERALKGFRFRLYGQKGTQLRRLRKRYNNRLNVQFCGSVPEDQIVTTYNSFKAFVFPSRWETFGLPIIEATACGTPVFVYGDSAITPEVKKYAIQIDNVSEIPSLLEGLGPPRLAEMSRRVRDEFGWDRHFEALSAIYKGLQG